MLDILCQINEYFFKIQFQLEGAFIPVLIIIFNFINLHLKNADDSSIVRIRAIQFKFEINY